MRKELVATALVFCLISGAQAPAQSTNGSIGGVVQDASKAVLPGVSVSLANTATGVVTTTVSNEAGAYTFPSVSPGLYKLSAELPGFRSVAYDQVEIGTSSQIRMDFTLLRLNF